jgi:hypothetical protein
MKKKLQDADVHDPLEIKESFLGLVLWQILNGMGSAILQLK